MRVFSWLTGNKDHHIEITRGKGKLYWWRIVRVEEDPRKLCSVEESDHKWDDEFTPLGIDVANQPTPGYDTFEHAEEGARAFLDGIGADYLHLERIDDGIPF